MERINNFLNDENCTLEDEMYILNELYMCGKPDMDRIIGYCERREKEFLIVEPNEDYLKVISNAYEKNKNKKEGLHFSSFINQCEFILCLTRDNKLISANNNTVINNLYNLICNSSRLD